MRQSIRGYADGVIDRTAGADLSAVASGLAAIGDVVAGSDDLRQVLSDPGVPVAARRGVLSDLFDSLVGETVVSLVNFVLDADRAGDTVEDVTWLAERFGAAAQGLEPAGVKVLGHKAAEERVTGYATAVLETLAGERDLGETEDELFRFQRVVAGSDELRDALSSRDLPAPVRKEIVTDLLAAKATPATVALATYATQVGRPRDYEDLLGALVDRVASESNRRVADVHSAIELDQEQQDRLAAALGRSVGRDVEVRVTVDPSVVAGFVATIGDTVVDGSARRQLELLKERLVAPEAAHLLSTNTATTGERH